MSDATSAAKAIQKRNASCEGTPDAFDRRDAGVVLARLSEAIQHLEAIREWVQHSSYADEHAVAALAALKEDTS